jgi:RNA polymerase sigma factor (sigma-70 family)
MTNQGQPEHARVGADPCQQSGPVGRAGRHRSRQERVHSEAIRELAKLRGLYRPLAQIQEADHDPAFAKEPDRRPRRRGILEAVDFKTVSTTGLESSPVAPRSPACGRTRPATSRTSTTTTSPSSRRARPRRPSTGCTASSRRSATSSSRPARSRRRLPGREHPDGLRVLRERPVDQRDVHDRRTPKKRAVGFKLSDGMEVPAELADARFKFARQKSKLAGTDPRLVLRDQGRVLTIDAVRREASAKRHTAEVNLELFEAPDDVHDEVWSAIRRRRLNEAMAGLPADQRRALSRAFLEGLTHVEVAEREGIPLGTAKTRIRTALLRLRAQLEPILSEELPQAAGATRRRAADGLSSAGRSGERDALSTQSGSTS